MTRTRAESRSSGRGARRKHTGPPRFISNTEAGLREPLRSDGSPYSILERSIRAALSGPPPVFADPLACRF
ncbi:hypothetical protein Sme01_63810 [Sphaerisporangium melleum]|uniref:Uncharacterized protein n=1 Tax=Sphaerisporangium melleum TaxID=321316 RepID=A0A917RF87_9ACTN|nr:hypothetical protein GCM10007964_54400 [Sphaerisporangium melleum]GII73905.1 hypothetical protein Sme01_63810 [Sphaerisporangium melleum]